MQDLYLPYNKHKSAPDSLLAGLFKYFSYPRHTSSYNRLMVFIYYHNIRMKIRIMITNFDQWSVCVDVPNDQSQEPWRITHFLRGDCFILILFWTFLPPTLVSCMLNSFNRVGFSDGQQQWMEVGGCVALVKLLGKLS